MAAALEYDIDYLDIVMAFLNDEKRCTSKRFTKKKQCKNQVCRLKKTIYGLKQEVYTWNKKLDQTLQEFNFKCSEIDRSLYIRKKNGGGIMYIITYVDDLLLFTNDWNLKQL